MGSLNSVEWNQLIARLPGAHILQTWQWGKLKSNYGWEPVFCAWVGDKTHTHLIHSLPREGEEIRAAALVLKRVATFGRFRLPFNILYVPKGPLLANWEDAPCRQQVLDDLRSIAKQNGSISIKIDPDVCVGYGEPGTTDDREEPLGKDVEEVLLRNGWHFSDEQIQFRNTVLVNLSQTEEMILARMKQKTRYNIRLAARKGVVVRKGTPGDLDLLYQMYDQTALRDNFIIRDADYYLKVWRMFMDEDLAQPLVAQVDSVPVAGLFLFRFSDKAWYLYGMSAESYREKMPNYLLQWEAMRYAKSAGCTVYDFWGAPDRFDENDPMWGVYRFKDGFGGEVVRTIGAWDKPIRPALYHFYTIIMPRVLDRMRRRSRMRRQQKLEI